MVMIQKFQITGMSLLETQLHEKMAILFPWAD